MLTIRCTRKLLRQVEADVTSETELPTTILGDWYANLFFTRRRRLIIAISERTLLPVCLESRNHGGFITRLRASVASTLQALGIASRRINRELHEMDRVGIGLTANRSVLGSLNDLILQARFVLDEDPEMDLSTLALEIADTPCSPLKYESPRSATLALFQ
jgi:hypothetical protein